MRVVSILIVALVSATVLGLSAGAQDRQPGKDSVKHAGFEKFKALAGDWEVTKGLDKSEGPGGSITYKVTAAGSVVLETLFAGTPHEMVTFYYLDGDDLALTHCCMLKNRPQMRAERPATGERIVFSCKKGENTGIEAEDHMHQATFVFVDSNHLNTEWVLYKGGKPDSTHAFTLTRK
jgi:hypothetical protein